ncbi:transmembrane protein, putative (macronuclear) [Tetrahymena thermophila SB210]|uniref:Transmembrane protein, putative n=1 Tax=Tetrahymena thermophila (strain SB210) TaxID=312017 RepID=W7XHR0_TETTS|nr:transmembrane protein, putative [Tetrahymena thermophila SB210]EWS73981.1 transmembrane protein, putative [Tetrahymena thermophila SB210]|eukprot:XP_012653484.1 transmembrane protein, putative [Tetrahymena thermophila SB210]
MYSKLMELLSCLVMLQAPIYLVLILRFNVRILLVILVVKPAQNPMMQTNAQLAILVPTQAQTLENVLLVLLSQIAQNVPIALHAQLVKLDIFYRMMDLVSNLVIKVVKLAALLKMLLNALLAMMDTI